METLGLPQAAADPLSQIFDEQLEEQPVAMETSSPDRMPPADQNLHALSSDQLSLMERLDIIASEPSSSALEKARLERGKRRLLCAAAAEDRRWRRTYDPRAGATAKTSDGYSGVPVPPLLELAEASLGRAFRERCEYLLPQPDYCALSYVPSPVDHNNEPCRIFKNCPAVEQWS